LPVHIFQKNTVYSFYATAAVIVVVFIQFCDLYDSTVIGVVYNPQH